MKVLHRDVDKKDNRVEFRWLIFMMASALFLIAVTVFIELEFDESETTIRIIKTLSLVLLILLSVLVLTAISTMRRFRQYRSKLDLELARSDMMLHTVQTGLFDYDVIKDKLSFVMGGQVPDNEFGSMWNGEFREGVEIIRKKHPEFHMDELLNVIQNVTVTRMQTTMETPLVWNDGMRWERIHISPLIDLDGNVEHVLGTSVDITESHRKSEDTRNELDKTRSMLDSMKRQKDEKENILHALAVDYEAIYSVNKKSDSYIVLEKKGNYAKLPINEYGQDFFADTYDNCDNVIFWKDLDYVKRRMNKDVVLENLGKSNKYTINYRLVIDGKPNFYQCTAINGIDEDTIIFGIRNVGISAKHEIEQYEKFEELLRKERVYRDAVMSNCCGYFEANLTTGYLTTPVYDYTDKNNPRELDLSAIESPLKFDTLKSWWAENMVVSEKESYTRFCNCARLMECFRQGKRYQEIEFKSRLENDLTEICSYREAFFLTEDERNSDVLLICVIVDNTELVRRQNEIENLNAQLKDSRIKSSTNQMQPHFLYNALSSIREIILEDPQYASDLICDFTTHLRACVRALSNDNLIPFSRELENVRAYTSIERMRFGSKLNVKIDARTEDFMIIPLSVQPLVENAIRHGLYERGPEGGTVTITTYDEEGYHIIEVSDDGVGFDYETVKSEVAKGLRDSTGLENLIFRFEKIMGASVFVDSVIGVGTTVVVKIPTSGRGEDEGNNS